ncbi:MAG: tetratricopeptide repeat protein, partial [bacterium]
MNIIGKLLNIKNMLGLTNESDKNKTEINTKDSFNFDNISNSNINQLVNAGIINKSVNFHIHDSDNNDEEISTEIKKKVKDIGKYFENAKYQTAIDKYNTLMVETLGKSLTDDDKYQIFNGLLNCYVNLNDDEKIERYINKIKALKNITDKHKFYFLSAVYFFNKQDYDKAHEEICKSIKINSEYLKGIALKYYIESVMRTIDYKTALDSLINENNELLIGVGNKKDEAYVFSILGYISLSFQQYENSIMFFEKADDKLPSYVTKSNIAISCFYKAIEKSSGEYINPNDVSYRTLREANILFEKLFNIDDVEIRENIRKLISPYYYKTLYLLNKHDQIDIIFDEIKGYYNSSELYRLKIYTEITQGKINPDTVEKVPVEDQQWVDFAELMEKREYEKLIEKLSPIVWDLKWEEGRYHGILLNAYLFINLEKFVTHIKELRDRKLSSDIINLMEGLYYEKIGDLEKAEEAIKGIVEVNDSYVFYEELVSFYIRNNLIEKCDSLYDYLLSNKNLIEQNKEEFYYWYFVYLIRYNKLLKAVEKFKNIKEEDMIALDYLKIETEIQYLVGNYSCSAAQFRELYEKTSNLTYLFNCAVSYFRCNRLDKSEEAVMLLLRNRYQEEESLYMIYSNIELLKGNIDKSLEYAYKAKSIADKNPYSPVHPFYVQKSIRCGKDPSYVSEYASKYPQNQQWLKHIKAIEVDEDGNEKLSQEMIDFLDSQKNSFNNIISNYRTHNIGLTILAKYQGRTIPEVFDWREIYNIDAFISSGNIQEVNDGVEIFDKEIIIDSIGLFILSEIDCLDLLESLDKVYITYSTINDLQKTILNIEKQEIREILDYIKKAINVHIIFPEPDIRIRINEKYLQAFEEYQIDSLAFSYANDINYVSCEPLLNKFVDGYTTHTINLISFFRALALNNVITKKELSQIVINLKKNKFSFVNFDAQDIYNIAESNNFELDENLKMFFRLEGNNLMSFINVYIHFFRLIYNNLE